LHGNREPFQKPSSISLSSPLSENNWSKYSQVIGFRLAYEQNGVLCDYLNGLFQELFEDLGQIIDSTELGKFFLI
jgi:hypothetical protein